MSFYSSKRLYVKIGVALGSAMVILGTAGDAFSSSNAIVVYLQKDFGFPENTIITVLLIFLIIILVAILAEVITRTFSPNRNPFTIAEEKRARKAYLSLMKKDIGNRLESSIHYARYVDLKLKESNAMVSAFHFTFQRSNEDEKIIESIAPLLESKEFSILLLGAPGAGKTTTVLNSINHCIEESLKDDTISLPILINLSKWRKNESFGNLLRIPGRKRKTAQEGELKTLDLDEWIIKTTAGLKRIWLTRTIVESWLVSEKVILFLDGLDEADESIRNLIVDKINDFIGKYPTISILVCSRLADYEALVNTTKVKLALDAAVTINPMTDEQIKEYLEAAKASQLQTLLDHDDELKIMARSPLDLSIMALASQYTDFKMLTSQQTHSITRKRVALFDAYVKAMVQREQRKRMPDSHLHDADFIELPVPEKKLSALYKYLEWIARLQSERSMSSFSPNKLYKYLSEKEAEKEESVINPKGHIQTVNITVLFVSLSILSSLFIHYYSIVFLITYPLVITVGYYFVCLIRLEDDNEKVFNITVYVIGWLLLMLVFPIIYLPFGALFSFGKFSIWSIVLLFTIAYLSTVYRITIIIKHGIIKAFKRTPWWKDLLNLIIISLPILYIVYFDGAKYPQWLFMYFLVVLINAPKSLFGRVSI